MWAWCPNVLFQTPRVWGRYHPQQCYRSPQLSDPTRVGKIDATERTGGEVIFRPHACGEDWLKLLDLRVQAFQTPRVWGRCHQHAERLRLALFRPHACGEDPNSLSCPQCGHFRPHACGEDVFSAIRFILHTFQTPRVWGRSQGRVGIRSGRLSDPTRVGKIILTTTQLRETHFRPHACGEDFYRISISDCKKLSDPTRVGKITITEQLYVMLRFRPHACGEDHLPNIFRTPLKFQTPRVWGR